MHFRIRMYHEHRYNINYNNHRFIYKYINFLIYVRSVLAAHQNLYAKCAKCTENREKCLLTFYFGCNTRPDIAFAVNACARFSDSPTYAACHALWILDYVSNTCNVGIVYRGTDFDTHGFCDTDWAGDIDTQLRGSLVCRLSWQQRRRWKRRFVC